VKLLHRHRQFIKREVIYAINIASAERQRRQPTRRRFGGHHHDVRLPALAIPDEVQSFRTRVLRPVTAQRPFGADTRMQQRSLALPLSEVRTLGYDGVNQQFRGIDCRVAFQAARHDHVGRYRVVIAKRRREVRILGRRILQSD